MPYRNTLKIFKITKKIFLNANVCRPFFAYAIEVCVCAEFFNPFDMVIREYVIIPWKCLQLFMCVSDNYSKTVCSQHSIFMFMYPHK